LKRAAVASAVLAAMAAPLVVMPGSAHADLASAVNSGSYGPVVSIVTPQYADVVTGKSVSIAVAVQQRTNPVQAVQMYVDDHIATPGWVPLKSLQSSKFNWDTTLFNNGPHKLTVRVADSQGLIGQAEITVYVNNVAAKASSQSSQQTPPVAPYLKWLGVQDGQMLKGVVNLQLEASGNFGVKYIFVMINSVDDPDRKPALRSWMINQPPYIVPFDTTKVNDGLYVLDALAYDALSNQGEAPRLHIGVGNNSINPTWYNQLAPYQTNGKSTESSLPKTAAKTANANTPAANNTSKSTSGNNSTKTANSNAGNGQFVNRMAQLNVPTFPQRTETQTVPTQSSQSSDAGESVANNEESLTVTTTSSAEVRRSPGQAAPRLSALPMDMAPEKTPEKSTTAEQASSKKSVTAAKATAPVATMAREAALPKEDATPAQVSLLTNPQSTVAASHGPDAVLATPATTHTPQRMAWLDDALSLPAQKLSTQAHAKVASKAASSKPADQQVSNVELPEFPQATLGQRSAAVPATHKSTFANGPAVGMTLVNVSSRIAPVKHSAHSAVRLADSSHLGKMPQRVRVASDASVPSFKEEPVFTVPTASLTGSRIAAVNLPGNSWNYQHIINGGQSTRPQLAFLPDFKSHQTAAKSLSAITLSPLSSKMQVNETTHAWPAVYVTKTSEPLAAVAKRYGLPVEVIAVNNNLKTSAQLQPGQKINMPRNLQVTYNGKPLHSDVHAMLVGTTSVAAFRFLFEQQGGSVTWDAATQTVHAKNADNEVTLTIGSHQAVVNQQEVMMDLAAFLLSGRTMVPVRLFEKSLQAQVTWDPATGRMFVAMAGSDS